MELELWKNRIKRIRTGGNVNGIVEGKNVKKRSKMT